MCSYGIMRARCVFVKRWTSCDHYAFKLNFQGKFSLQKHPNMSISYLYAYTVGSYKKIYMMKMMNTNSSGSINNSFSTFEEYIKTLIKKINKIH